ncbi:MAG: hypothetical protein MUO91_00930, partial [candidate division Zixibacteria bacterium]|nr:hypothetical protein [candidate division Zixibacteria bacterium]
LRSSEKRKRIKASDSKPKKGNEKLKSGQRIERMKRIDQRMKRIKRTCGELAEPYSSVLSVQSHLSQLTVDSLFFHLFNLLGIF